MRTVAALFLLLLCGCSKTSTADPISSAAKRVTILGYDDQAMEPFVTRDGRYLLFNNLNDPSVDTDIHFAERKDDFTWQYRGKVNGLNTPALEGCATMDRHGRMFFVSPRSYGQTFCTIYTCRFKDGAASEVQLVEPISLKKPGMVNFDVDVSPDGQTLVFVDSEFKGGGPKSADLVLARKEKESFVRVPESARLLGQVNTTALEYAPTISADGLTLYFTRFGPATGYSAPQIYRATRPAPEVPFGSGVHVPGLGGFVEGSALSPDEHLLYFHRKDSGRFQLYAVPIP